MGHERFNGRGPVRGPRARNRRCVLDEVEHAVLNTGLDQRGGFVDELLAVAHKREQHADGQVAGDAGAGAEIDHQDIAGTLDQGSLAMRQARLHPRETGFAVDGIGVAGSQALAVDLAPEELDRLDCARGLDNPFKDFAVAFRKLGNRFQCNISAKKQ